MRAEHPIPASAVLDTSSGEPMGDRRRRLFRVVGLVGWGLVLGVEVAVTIRNPGLGNIIITAGIAILFVLVYLQLILARWIGHRNLRRVTGRLHGSAYLSEFHDLPNRNYLLAELRREMPRARTAHTPFMLLQLSLDDLDGIRERRGEEFAKRSVNALSEVLKRLTRSSDFLAHLGTSRFCVMLVECTSEQSWTFLRRVPGTIAVSDGQGMFDVPVTARVHQYDLEALYATDVLAEVETMRALRRREERREGSIAA